MDQFELKEKFTQEFFEEFIYYPEFQSIFKSMTKGATAYEVIEHLCKSKRELLESIKKSIEDTPTEIPMAPEKS